MSPPVSLPAFERQTVCVVGDLIADRYVVAEPSRLSREAPVMVLRHVEERIGAGGAANVARNLRALGARVKLCGLVGRDANGRELLSVLEAEGIETSGVETVPGRRTPTKTRVLAAEPRRNPQQVLRIDEEPDEPPDERAREELRRRLRGACADSDALVLSDYGYRTLDRGVAELARRYTRDGGIGVLDPRRDLEQFGGLTAVTPNVGELATFTGLAAERLDEPAELERAAALFRERVPCEVLLVTRGNLGMALFGHDARGIAVEASGTGDVTDVSGAGDTAAAVFALALAARCTPAEAMTLANAASGVVVMESGAAVCSPRELERALRDAPTPGALAEASS